VRAAKQAATVAACAAISEKSVPQTIDIQLLARLLSALS
jgi:hypothetical protein